MSTAKNGSKVKVHYSGKLEDGTEFDNSQGGSPLEFTIGENQVIKGFENGVIGLEIGEKKTIKIEPEDAYGPYHEDYVYNIEKSKMPDNITLEVGRRLTARHEDGSALEMVIKHVEDESVTLDANHPLAGQKLIFDIELIDIEGLIIT